jgi:hypothetical protein
VRLIIIRGGLKDIAPNQVLGDVMTQGTYRVKREGVDQDKKKDDDKKKKSVAFCKCNHALIVGFGDNDHMIRGLMRFIEMTSR